VQKAEIEIVARVEGLESVPETGNVSLGTRLLRRELARRDFVARVDSLEAAGATDGAPRVRIRIEVTQADLPGGTAFLLRKLEEKADERSG
jgi:hypothetical protein